MEGRGGIGDGSGTGTGGSIVAGQRGNEDGYVCTYWCDSGIKVRVIHK